MASSTDEQKQVGHTIVQFPQVRQRSATSSQRGCSRLSASRSRRSPASISRPIRSAAPSIARSAASTSLRAAARAGSSREHLGAALRARFDEQSVLAVDDLGQREVVPCLGLRPRPHRDAEARAARLEAVDGDDERALSSCGVVAVDDPPADEHPVLDLDRVELARAHADECEQCRLERLLVDLERAFAVLGRLPEPGPSREEELLPRVRPDRVAEARLVVAPLQSIRARRPGGRSSRSAGRRRSRAPRTRSPRRRRSARGSDSRVSGARRVERQLRPARSPPGRPQALVSSRSTTVRLRAYNSRAHGGSGEFPSCHRRPPRWSGRRSTTTDSTGSTKRWTK